jgi:hypothetical protein
MDRIADHLGGALLLWDLGASVARLLVAIQPVLVLGKLIEGRLTPAFLNGIAERLGFVRSLPGFFGLATKIVAFV